MPISNLIVNELQQESLVFILLNRLADEEGLTMKVAIFHDYFTFIGGGEKLVLTMARHLGADIITTEANRGLISKMGFDDVRIVSLGDLSKRAPLRQIQATAKFASCDFRGRYDFFVFSGNWAHHASRRHRPNLFYCHAPVRVFYDQRDAMAKRMKNPAVRYAFLAWTVVHSFFDKRSVGHIDKIVTSSRNTAGRIKKYLGRDSTIIYPPCDTSRFRYLSDDGFWLSVNRLYPEKRVDMQIDAFREMPGERLIIIGNCGVGDHSEEYAKKLRHDLPPNVTIVSDVTEEALADYYGRCRGLIATTADEDFGMAVVEAMAAGKPVIAVHEGGFLETVVDGETGMLIDASPGALVGAVRRLSASGSAYASACTARSQLFDRRAFEHRIDESIQGKVG